MNTFRTGYQQYNPPYTTPITPQYPPAYASLYSQPSQTYPQHNSNVPQNNQNSQTISGFGWVDGINSAKAQSIPNGTSWIFFDVKDKVFYIKTVGTDGVPQPLFIAKYSQVNENELSPQVSSEPQVDMSEYLKKSDIDLNAFATKSDIAKLIESLSNQRDYVKNDELEDKVLQVIQEKMIPTSSAKKKRPSSEEEA